MNEARCQVCADLSVAVVGVRSEGSCAQECITTKQGWLNLCVWIDLMACRTIPFVRIWHLTHLRTFGWTDQPEVLEQELLAMLRQDELPKWVREILWDLARVVKNHTEEDGWLNVVCDPM